MLASPVLQNFNEHPHEPVIYKNAAIFKTHALFPSPIKFPKLPLAPNGFIQKTSSEAPRMTRQDHTLLCDPFLFFFRLRNYIKSIDATLMQEKVKNDVIVRIC